MSRAELLSLRILGKKEIREVRGVVIVRFFAVAGRLLIVF